MSVRRCRSSGAISSSSMVIARLPTFNLCSAKNIKNKPQSVTTMEKSHVISDITSRLAILQKRLHDTAAADGKGIFIPMEEYEAWENKINVIKAELDTVTAVKLATEVELANIKAMLEDTRSTLESLRETHEELKVELKSTQETLAVTQTELSTEKVAHDESKVVMRAHAHTENVLTTQAQGVLSTLKGAVTDVAGLHAKIGRSTSVMSANKRSGETFANAAAVRLGNLGNAATTFREVTSERVSGLRETIGSFLASKAEDTAAIASALNKVRSDIRVYTASTTDAAGALDAQTSKMCFDANAVADAAQSKAHAAADANAEAVAAALATIQAQLEAQSQQLAAWASASTSALDALGSSVSSFVASHTASLASISGGIVTSAREVDASLQSQLAELEAYRASDAAATRAAADQLLAQVSSLVNGFVADRALSTNASVAELSSSTSVARGTVASMQQSATSSIATVRSAADSWAAGAGQDIKRARTHVVKAMEGCNLTVGEAAAAVNAGGVANAAFAGALKATADGFAAFAHSSHDTIAKIVSGYASKTKSSSLSSGQTLAGDCDAVHSLSERALERTRHACGSLDKASVELHGSVDAYVESVGFWVADEGTSLHNFFNGTLQDDVPTGRTPAKKEYVAPSAFVATSPADVIIGRYRNARMEHPSMATPEKDARAFGAGSNRAMPPTVPLVMPRDRNSIGGGNGEDASTLQPQNPRALISTGSSAALLGLTRYRTSSISSVGSATASNRLSGGIAASSMNRLSSGSGASINSGSMSGRPPVVASHSALEDTASSSTSSATMMPMFAAATPAPASRMSSSSLPSSPAGASCSAPMSPTGSVTSSIPSITESLVSAGTGTSNVSAGVGPRPVVATAKKSAAGAAAARARFAAIGSTVKAQKPGTGLDSSVVAVPEADATPVAEAPAPAFVEPSPTASVPAPAAAPESLAKAPLVAGPAAVATSTLAGRIAAAKPNLTTMKSAANSTFAPPVQRERSPAPSPGRATRAAASNENVAPLNATMPAAKPSVPTRESRLLKPTIASQGGAPPSAAAAAVGPAARRAAAVKAATGSAQ